jgi:predicted enzyme related to lactoylglutathione lyase
MHLRLELVTVPVSDVDRAKAFYVDQVGFSTEQDVQVDEEHRFVELMPPGSPCSIALTSGYVDSKPGSLKGIQVNVDDVEEVHALLRDRGVNVSDIQEYPWGRFCFFSDPDGNGCPSTSRRPRTDRASDPGQLRPSAVTNAVELTSPAAGIRT